MNVDWAPGGRQPSDQAYRLGLSVRRKLAIWQLPSTSTIVTVIITQPVGWHSFYRPTEGEKLSKGAQPVPKGVYRIGCRQNITCAVWFKPESSHTAVGRDNHSASAICSVASRQVSHKYPTPHPVRSTSVLPRWVSFSIRRGVKSVLLVGHCE